MNHYLTATILSVTLTTAAVATRGHERVPVATETGPAKSCIPLRSIRETRVRDDRTIDFVTSGRKAFRNVLPDACPGLGFEQRFAYATSLGQLCSTDIITVLYQTGGARGASCGLGKFQPVTLAKPRR